MRLERLALHLRRRGPWEAIDLGCRMARTWWRPLVAAWLTIYAPCAVLLYTIFHSQPFIALAVLWWLKPLFDRVALEVLSRAVFGDAPRPLEAVRALKTSPGVLASLTVRRFDLARSFNLPVWHLERLTGSAARERSRSLQRRGRGPAVWLTIVFFHFEAVITFAFLGALDFFTPAGRDLDFGLKTLFWSEGLPVWRHALAGVFQVATITLLEPFYVAAGFALYLNRRTQLEAWDVELALRRIAAGAAVALLVLACVFPHHSYAAAAEPSRAIEDVLAQPEFEQHRDTTRLRFRGRNDTSNAPDAPAPHVPALGVFAELARVLMWLAAAAVVALLLYHARRYVTAWGPDRTSGAAPPQVLFGLDVTPESLPPDVAAAALAAADAGRAREALGLLYRGALSVLINRDGLQVGPGDTESDCVRRAATRVDSPKAEAFAELVSAWQAVAYAGRAPSRDALRALCAAWDASFGTRRSE